MARGGWNRRELLIGTALALGTGLAQKVRALKGAARSVVIPTHEFAGETDERLGFGTSTS